MVGSVAEISSELPPRLGTERRLVTSRKNRPAEVRASVVAMKRVMTVEPRDAGKWMREGTSD